MRGLTEEGKSRRRRKVEEKEWKWKWRRRRRRGEEARARSVRRRPGGNFGSTTPAMPASGASPWPGESFWDGNDVTNSFIQVPP